MKAHAVRPGTRSTYCGRPSNQGHTYNTQLGRVTCVQCLRLLKKRVAA